MFKKSLSLCFLAMLTLQMKAQYLEKIYDYIENTNVFEENQEEGHAYYLADKHIPLNGTWKFLFSNTPEEVPQSFFQPAFSDSKWRNNVNSNGNQDTYNFSYGGHFQYNAPWGTQISTDMRMSSRRGYSQASMNTNELLWNASISHSILQGKALTLKAEIFDILHQQTNISRAVDAFSRRDSRNNTIYQYAMFSAIYRFSIYGGKNTMGTDKERKD